MESKTRDPLPIVVVPAGELDRALFAPVLGLATLIIALSAAVSLRHPLHGMVASVECLVVVLFAAGCWRWHRARSARPLVGFGLLAALAAWLVFADYAGWWLPTGADLLGPHPDSWSYQAFADYLDHYPRGQRGGMPMVDEFGAHLQGTRFAAATLLAFLHDQPLFADVPTARLLFSALCLGVHFFSMLALGRALIGYSGWLMPLFSAGLATAGGWFSRVLMYSNNDNMIFAALTPALLALCCAPRAAAGPVAVRWQVLAAIALVFGAMLYNYPEGTALLGVLCSPLIIALGWRGTDGRFQIGRWLEIGGGGLLGVALAGPYLLTFVAFLHHQMNSGMTTGSAMRPGEGLLPGLLGSNRFSGMFALGDEAIDALFHPASNLLALGLAALAVVGAVLIARRQRWFPWVVLPLVGLYLWQSVAMHYDYGTYKVLLTASWWVYSAVGAGVLWIVERYRLRAGGVVALVAALLLGIGLVKGGNRLRRPPVALADRIKSLQELSTLHFVTGQSPVLLSLDDDFDYTWATYYLRGLPLGTWKPRGYLAMPHIAPFLADGIRPPPESCPYRLVTGHPPDALWQNSRFALVRTQAVYLADLENPTNGLETVDGQRFLWVGTQPTTFHLVARSAGRYALSVARFDFGPSMGGRADVHVAVTDSEGTHPNEIAAGASTIPLHLAAGDNAVVLRCLDTPEPGPHNGDSRELMLGLLGPSVTVPE